MQRSRKLRGAFLYHTRSQDGRYHEKDQVAENEAWTVQASSAWQPMMRSRPLFASVADDRRAQDHHAEGDLGKSLIHVDVERLTWQSWYFYYIGNRGWVGLLPVLTVPI